MARERIRLGVLYYGKQEASDVTASSDRDDASGQGTS
jgi:hypothetical protein